jgi:diphosphomevalonate decarboxylase
MRASALAHPNLALVKYFGKADAALNLPATPSLGVTVAGLTSRAVVTAERKRREDLLRLDGAPSTSAALARASKVWDALRARAGEHWCFTALCDNDFPAATGLASSASGMAALALASAHACGLQLAPAERAQVARLGSGSAARACFGGWVRFDLDGTARPVEGAALAVEVLTLQVASRPKEVSSGQAMELARRTSSRYALWLEECAADFQRALAALAAGDFQHLARVTERNWRRMHHVLVHADPPLVYAGPESLEVIDILEEMRSDAPPFAASMDLGPNIFLVTPAGHGPGLLSLLQARAPQAPARLHAMGEAPRLTPA